MYEAQKEVYRIAKRILTRAKGRALTDNMIKYRVNGWRDAYANEQAWGESVALLLPVSKATKGPEYRALRPFVSSLKLALELFIKFQNIGLLQDARCIISSNLTDCERNRTVVIWNASRGAERLADLAANFDNVMLSHSVLLVQVEEKVRVSVETPPPALAHAEIQ